jgi:hypothetical protein
MSLAEGDAMSGKVDLEVTEELASAHAHGSEIVQSDRGESATSTDRWRWLASLGMSMLYTQVFPGIPSQQHS